MGRMIGMTSGRERERERGKLNAHLVASPFICGLSFPLDPFSIHYYFIYDYLLKLNWVLHVKLKEFQIAFPPFKFDDIQINLTTANIYTHKMKLNDSANRNEAFEANSNHFFSNSRSRRKFECKKKKQK